MKNIKSIILSFVLVAGLEAQVNKKIAQSDELTIDPSTVKGTISLAGSSTVFPLVLLLAEQFKAEGFQDQLTIDNVGSGSGIQRLCDGEVDLALASRKMKEKEETAFFATNRGQLQEYLIGTNAIVILANSRLNFMTNITITQAQKIFGDASVWSDVDSSWPTSKINRYIPETTHGIFDYIAHFWWKDKGKALKAASNTQRFQDYNQLIDNIDKDPNGIGFVGYGYYRKTYHSILVSYESVIPDPKDKDKNYKICNSLYIYTSDKILQNNPQVADFLAFVLTNTNRQALRAGFFPLAETDLNNMKMQLSSTLRQTQ